MVFFKPPSSLIGSGESIVLPSICQRVEFEAEFGVVIARRLRNADPAPAERGIGGDVFVTEVPWRDLQKTDGQWGRAKGFDTFCPLGPWIETELDPSDLFLRSEIDDDIRQDGTTADMLRSVGELVEWTSSVMTLLPGDVLL